MSKEREALKLARDWIGEPPERRTVSAGKMVAILTEALAEQPAQQCKWPTCQSEEYQQALAEQLKRELVGEQPAQQEPVAIEHCIWARSGNRPCPHTSTPAQQEPLTDAQIGAVAAKVWGSVLIAPQSYQAFARAIEAAHGIKEKNNERTN
jgi:hypothetical protein